MATETLDNVGTRPTGPGDGGSEAGRSGRWSGRRMFLERGAGRAETGHLAVEGGSLRHYLGRDPHVTLLRVVSVRLDLALNQPVQWIFRRFGAA